jgi:hypothetical protein
MAINDACLCGTGMNNTGLVTCIKGFKKTTGFLIVPMLANDGTRNSINLSPGINLQNKVKHTDPSSRFYPVNDLKDVELPTAESRFETAKDGSKFKLADGIKSFKAVIYEGGSMFASKLQGVSCEKYGVYLYDIDGNLRGIKEDDELYPIEIGGWDTIFMDATDDNVSKIQIQFDFDILLKISRYWILSAADLGINPNSLLGLVDANLIEVSSGVTSTVLDISSDYGSGLSALPIVGLTSADFSVYNENDSASVAVSVAESTTIDGQYTLTYSTQTLLDVLKIQVVPTSGYDGTVKVTI